MSTNPTDDNAASTDPSSSERDPVMVAAFAIILVGLVFVTFNTVLQHNLVMWDDHGYILENRNLAGGITKWKNIQWAFEDDRMANYHPLTWLSLQLDVTLYDMSPWPSGHKAWGFKLTNLILHCANTVLLFWLFLKMTGQMWPSAFIAALFGVHPLHVESVAWVTERKDVLSTFFCLLAILAYLRYVHLNSWLAYIGMLILFALSLLAKQMYVTLFGVLLLLDYWPLRRILQPQPDPAGHSRPFGRISLSRAILEKVPVLVLAVASSILIYQVQANNPDVLNVSPALSLRIQNALYSYCVYLGQTFWPFGLSFFYPYPKTDYSLADRIWPIALLTAVTIAVVVLRRRAPYLTCGWFWYLGTLLPVIGIVQVGWQAHADRYTYFPLIGIFMALAFSLEALVQRLPSTETVVRVVMGVLVACSVWLGMAQVGVWADTDALTIHALKVDKDNFIANVQLGTIGAHDAQWEKAREFLIKGRDIEPKYLIANKNLALVELVLGDDEAAAQSYRIALEIAPRDAELRFQLGLILLGQGKPNEAIEQFQQALDIRDTHVQARFALAIAFEKAGDRAAARKELSAIRENIRTVAIKNLGEARANEVLEHATGKRTASQQLYRDAGLALDVLDKIEAGDPEAKERFAKRFDWPPTYFGSITALKKANMLWQRAKLLADAGNKERSQNDRQRAIEEFERALELWPNNYEALFAFGMVQFENKDLASARKSFEAVLAIEPNDPGSIYNLGVIDYTEGKTEEARRRFHEVLAIDPKHSDAQAALAKVDAEAADAVLSDLGQPADPEIELDVLLDPGAIPDATQESTDDPFGGFFNP